MAAMLAFWYASFSRREGLVGGLGVGQLLGELLEGNGTHPLLADADDVEFLDDAVGAGVERDGREVAERRVVAQPGRAEEVVEDLLLGVRPSRPS